jgi:hypothetical protein
LALDSPTYPIPGTAIAGSVALGLVAKVSFSSMFPLHNVARENVAVAFTALNGGSNGANLKRTAERGPSQLEEEKRREFEEIAAEREISFDVLVSLGSESATSSRTIDDFESELITRQFQSVGR